MNFLLTILRFLLGALSHEHRRLEPVLLHSDGRTGAAPPNCDLPKVWAPGWGWMISSTITPRREATRRGPAARPGGARRRAKRPPAVWRDH